jgi:hypothetical protein
MVILPLSQIRLLMEQRLMRAVRQESKCYWHFGKCAPLLTGAERPGLPSVISLHRRSLSSPMVFILYHRSAVTTNVRGMASDS